MSSSQQIPVGIPASQNPYPSLPYSQNFPNEPDTESSQFINNHSQNYYPPHSGHGQQPVPMSQPGQYYGAAQSSHQQSQFIVAPIDPERIKLGTKIGDIDKRLESGCYFVYKILLWLSIIGAVIGLLQFSINFLFTAALDRDFQGSSAIIFTVVTLLLLSSYAWGLQSYLAFKNAMNDKSLEGARRGFKLMVSNSAYFIAVFIIIIRVLAFGRNPLLENLQKNYYLPSSLLEIIILYTPITLLWLFVTKKIVDLLAEREIVVQEINTRYGPNLV